MACRCINFSHWCDFPVFRRSLYWCNVFLYYHSYHSSCLFSETLPLFVAEDGSRFHLGSFSSPSSCAVQNCTQLPHSCKSFPRDVHDHYFVNWYTSIGGVVSPTGRCNDHTPISEFDRQEQSRLCCPVAQWTGSPYGFWELDSSISPALIILLIYGAWTILSHKPRFDKSNLLKKGIAGDLPHNFHYPCRSIFNGSRISIRHIEWITFAKVVAHQYPFCFFFRLPLAILGVKLSIIGQRGNQVKNNDLGSWFPEWDSSLLPYGRISCSR